MIFCDIELSRKLERAEGRANADFVATRARLDASVGAEWMDIGGTYVMFDGVGSPCTQTFGLGLFEDANAEDLSVIETFFRERGSDIFHEVSPLADQELLGLLSERRYRPIELTNVMYRPLVDIGTSGRPETSRITTRIISPNEFELWARTSAAGWATEHEGLADFMFDFGSVSAQCAGAYPYIAEIDDNAVATGMMFVHEDVAMFAGASTVPDGRKQGAQNALFEARLDHAAKLGCTLAAMGASPGSQSQKNAQKNGFQIAYTRTKWQLSGENDLRMKDTEQP